MPALGQKWQRASLDWLPATSVIANRFAGACGNCESIASQAFECITPWSERACVLLLCGGDKRKQTAEIRRAIEYWEDYQRRMDTT